MYDELTEVAVPEIWAGVDIGKEHHHCVVIDAQGKRLLSRRVLNDETELLQLMADVLALSRDVLWAVDINHGGAALLLGLLVSHGQHVTYITGLAVHRASAGYRGQAKTDAKDAFVIADQARMRTDLGVLRPGDEIAVDLRTLVTRRTDLVCDRTRQINRLRAQLLEIFPALERSLDLTKKGPVMLLTGYQTPAAIRRAGTSRVATWLKNRKVRGSAALAKTVVEAAEAQFLTCSWSFLTAAGRTRPTLQPCLKTQRRIGVRATGLCSHPPIKFADALLTLFSPPPLLLPLLSRPSRPRVPSGLRTRRPYDADRGLPGAGRPSRRVAGRGGAEVAVAGPLDRLAHELADVAYGTALAHGIDLDAVIAEIHRASMTKLGPDGRVSRRADGKGLKGDHYRAPDVSAVLRDQGWEPRAAV